MRKQLMGFQRRRRLEIHITAKKLRLGLGCIWAKVFGMELTMNGWHIWFKWQGNKGFRKWDRYECGFKFFEKVHQKSKIDTFFKISSPSSSCCCIPLFWYPQICFMLDLFIGCLLCSLTSSSSGEEAMASCHWISKADLQCLPRGFQWMPMEEKVRTILVFTSLYTLGKSTQCNGIKKETRHQRTCCASQHRRGGRAEGRPRRVTQHHLILFCTGPKSHLPPSGAIEDENLTCVPTQNSSFRFILPLAFLKWLSSNWFRSHIKNKITIDKSMPSSLSSWPNSQLL